MRTRALTAVLVLSVTAACSSAVDSLTDVLTPSPSSPSTPSPSSPSTPSPTPSVEPTHGAKPPIVVRTPVAGDEVGSPVTIAGTANVFEATVSIRILDQDGMELAASYTTATCGSGCRGKYSTEVFFFTERRQPGTIEVFEVSAEDGSQLHTVIIPVTLVPGL